MVAMIIGDNGGDRYNHNDDKHCKTDDDNDHLDILPFKLPHVADNTCLWRLSRRPPSGGDATV